MKFHRIIFIIAIIWYALTAYFSNGYFHADEHYQIIEFSGILNGTNTAKDLAWEYHAQIRPALQPTICYLIFKACDFISITNPYHKAFILRLITGLLSVIAIFFFTNSCKSMILPKNRKLFLVLSYFLWFLPFINVRFSSETWSGIALLFALSFIIRNKTRFQTYLLIGCLIGLSFLFRYQIVFASLGLILWLIFIRHETIPKISIVLASAVLVVIVGFFIDSWYYGQWTLTFWKYFNVNLIEGKADQFGTEPWYFYINHIIQDSFFPIGILILALFFFLIIKQYNSIFIWTILPFLFIHSVIAHKEVRFLFPLINFIPVILIIAKQEIPQKMWVNRPNYIIKVLLITVLIINTLGVIVASIKPAGAGRIRITQEIYNMDTKKHVNIYFANNSNPYSPWGITTNFYAQQKSDFKRIDLTKPYNIPATDSNTRNVLVVGIGDDKNTVIQNFINGMNMKEKCRSIPRFMNRILSIYGYNNYESLIMYSD
jgi:GPI mannosyltransferase 3